MRDANILLQIGRIIFIIDAQRALLNINSHNIPRFCAHKKSLTVKVLPSGSIVTFPTYNFSGVAILLFFFFWPRRDFGRKPLTARFRKSILAGMYIYARASERAV